MRLKLRHTDFLVEECIRFPGDQGGYAYYRVEKRGASSPAVLSAMAAHLGIPSSAVTFPALKDAAAVTVQYASVQGKGPVEISGKGFSARRVGWGPRALQPRDLCGNRFVLVVRDLAEADAGALGDVLRALEAHGLPNYYDDQRFGSRTSMGFPGRAILDRDAEKAVRLYLAEPQAGDPRPVRAFKAVARENWGAWAYLLDAAPRPSNLRSVLTYLKDHPQDYRRAANLIQDRLLSIYLSAYQSWVWNRIAARYLEGAMAVEGRVEISGEAFPLPARGVDLAGCTTSIPLPRLGARYGGALAEAAQAVLDDEGLSLDDFKARILRRAYLPKGQRDLRLAPADVDVGPVIPDVYTPGRHAVQVSFSLPPGSYATLVMKAAAARLGTSLR